MTMIKTAISMPKPIFDEVNEAARELNLSRSGVIVQALRDFLFQLESDRMLAQLNAAWDDEPDADEREYLRWTKHHALALAARLEEDG
jgi:hypothetical protein